MKLKNMKRIYLIAIMLCSVMITSCTHSVSENWESRLLIPNPQWEKFVKVETGATLFDSPSTGSNVLLQNTEDDCYLPVIEESNGWYKVLCYTPKSFVLSQETYIKDTECEEIIPERITHDVLSNNNIYVLGGNGIYQNLCIAPEVTPMFQKVGEVVNDYCIAFSNRYDRILFWNDRHGGKTYEVNESKREDGFSDYYITINSCEFEDGDVRIELMRSLPEEQIGEFVVTFVKTIPQANSTLRYYFYFPSISDSKLVKFHVAKEITTR